MLLLNYNENIKEFQFNINNQERNFKMKKFILNLLIISTLLCLTTSCSTSTDEEIHIDFPKEEEYIFTINNTSPEEEFIPMMSGECNLCTIRDSNGNTISIIEYDNNNRIVSRVDVQPYKNCTAIEQLFPHVHIFTYSLTQDGELFRTDTVYYPTKENK